MSSFLLWQIFNYFYLYSQQFDLEIRTENWADNIPVFPVFQKWNWAPKTLQKSGKTQSWGMHLQDFFHFIGFSHPGIKLEKYYHERMPSSIVQKARNVHFIFWRHFFFIDMRSCYPLFPTNVWPMVVQIFLDNIRESADMLATPLKKA